MYVYNLLVRRSHRGNNLGKLLIENVKTDYSDQPLYIMSDADGYYKKLGCRKIGSVFEV